MTVSSNQIIYELKKRLTPFLNIKEFSSNPGIYAIGFNGKDFPFPIEGNIVTKGDIIYIGKTEKSQKSRDAQTHFKSGKTGSSTLRRSLGAILIDTLDLKPIPRSQNETRMRDYKFIKECEQQLTDWMIKNLSLSFFDFLKGKRLLRDLEKEIIIKCNPILNIQGNSSLNPYAGMLKEMRAKCKNIAKIQLETKTVIF
jgi:hypothetical protein